jgi:hypothetical protein
MLTKYYSVIIPRRMWHEWVRIEMHARFFRRNLKERDYLEHLGVDKDNIKLDLTEEKLEGVEWSHLIQHRYKWRVVVNTVMKFGFSLDAWNFLNI